jgi:hypothetical protein
VRYVLEGSVRRAGNRVRITGQLIDSSTGAHLWADRVEGAFEDIFDLQDQVTSRVVGEIAPQLEKAEIERAKRKPTESLDAYDQLLRGMEGFHKWSREGNDEALLHFYEAIQLDPNYAVAYASNLLYVRWGQSIPGDVSAASPLYPHKRKSANETLRPLCAISGHPEVVSLLWYAGALVTGGLGCGRATC